MVAGIVKVLEHNMEKAGFISKIANFTSLGQLKKILNLKDFDVNYETIGKLKQELEFANMEWSLRKIEADIQKQETFTC